MSKNNEELNEKNKQFLTTDDPVVKNSQSSIVKSGYGTPESNRSWKKLERDKNEFVDAPTDKETDSKLKRSISFPSHSEKKSKGKDLQLRYPFHEEEGEAAGLNSPVLYQSKSSLWSVTSDTSSVANRKYKEKSRELNKTSENHSSALSDQDETQRCMSKDCKLNKSCTPKEASHSQQASPQPVKYQQPTYVTISSDKANSDKKRTKGLTFSVQDVKAKTDRDPELINEDLKIKDFLSQSAPPLDQEFLHPSLLTVQLGKLINDRIDIALEDAFRSVGVRNIEGGFKKCHQVNFQDIIAEPHGYYTPQFSWSLSGEVFNFAKACVYTVVSFLCAIPLACFWGIWFSILTCCNVWCLMPCKRSHIINIAYWKFCWGAIVSCFCDPLCRSLGMTLSNISMRTEKHIV